MASDLRTRLLEASASLKEEAKSMHGEWLGKGRTDELLRWRAEKMREAAKLMGECIHAMTEHSPKT